jgi:REP element-mobilizing transposase RayT
MVVAIPTAIFWLAGDRLRLEEHRGWFQPKKLPHFDAEVTQSITIRLADSLPKHVLESLVEDMKSVKFDVDTEKRRRLESLLDSGYGSGILGEAQCAKIVQGALLFLNQRRFDLRAWVVMPNHWHFLARFHPNQTLEKGLHSLKSYTANELKKLHPEMGSIWQEGYFDRYIRSEEHYWNAVNYICRNPVVAGLCAEPSDFRWSSAFEERE